MARKNKESKNQKKSVYIIGEGLTEQYYFQHLKRIKGYACSIKPRLFDNTSILNFEKKIDELINEEADIICVFDADVLKRNPVENERLQNLKHKYADNNRVLICDSLQCIEYWFILHYEDICPFHNNAKETVKRLKAHIPDYNKSEQYLKKPQWVKSMNMGDSLPNACERAKRHDGRASYTKVYKAINRLDETVKQ
ncbi:MAG: RloB family protein [Tannerella sp.]|jgi:hypothetical protein|nr:RloB family protein [Tannerella sp.]